MSKYNYFDDEPEYEETLKDKLIVYAVCAYDAVKEKIRNKNSFTKSAAEEKIKNVFDKKGKLLQILSFLLFIVFIACIVLAFISNINRSNERLKKYYTDAGAVCSEIMTAYGSCKTSGTDYRELWNMNGLCYVRQLDFDDDHSDELLIAYSNSGKYYAEVWGYKGKEFINYYRQPVNVIENEKISASFITVYNRNGKYYLGIVDSQDSARINMLQLKGEEFKESSYSCEYDAEKDLYAVKGKINSTDFETIRLSYLSASKAEKLVDIVNSNLNSFIASPAKQANAPKTPEQLKADAYYNVVLKRIEKYGKPAFDTKDDISFAGGTAIVRLIDFDADGNEELLIISRKNKKVSETDKKGESIITETPEYKLEVYGWQEEKTVKLYENDGVSQMLGKDNSSVFCILRIHDDNTVDICNNAYTYGKRSDKMWTGTSRIVALKDGEFTTEFSAKVSCQYGDMSYYIDDSHVSRTTFNSKGYVVPYFCNEDDYDKNEFRITKLQGEASDSAELKEAVNETNKTISRLNASYIAN